MAAFFILTNDSISGPFTGIELREAALAGIVRPGSIVGGSPSGPWHRATSIGLFSDKNVALPHPEETDVPSYKVRGLAGAIEGPFKLRKLIGLASRGLLPPAAQLRCNDSETWIPAIQLRILEACLNGQLVLLDEDGGVIIRTEVQVNGEATPVPTTARAPIEVAKYLAVEPTPVHSLSDDVEARAAEAELTRDSAVKEAERALRQHYNNSSVDSPSWGMNDKTDHQRPFAPTGWARSKVTAVLQKFVPQRYINERLTRRLVTTTGIGILLIASGVAAMTYYSNIKVSRDDVVGQWMSYRASGDEEIASLGIAFRSDGSFTVCNTSGPSWSGTFDWSHFQADTEGLTCTEPFTATIDQASPFHEKGLVQATDGHVRLAGFVKDPPVIDGHAVRDFFVRREDENLLVGYPLAIHCTPQSTSTEVGWIRLRRCPGKQRKLATDLRKIAPKGHSGPPYSSRQTVPHVSEAIKLANDGFVVPHSKQKTLHHQSRAFSRTVTLSWLLDQYGMPDEARLQRPFEIPLVEEDEAKQLSGASMLRYGTLQLMFDRAGNLRYLVVVN